MNFQKLRWLIGGLAIVLIAGAISLSSRYTHTSLVDPVLRIPVGPVSVQPVSEGFQVASGEAIQPVVVHLKDLPAGVYTPNNKYDRWLRGELDPRESEYRQGELRAAELKAEAMSLPASFAVQIATNGPGLKAPVPGFSFDSMDYNEGGGSVPPDPEMAAGPNHLIAVVNTSLEIYTKSGTTLFGPTATDTFFASLPACVAGPSGSFDPNVVYDEEADRWIIAVDGNGTHYCIAVSQTSDPTGAYNMYAVPAQPVGGEFHDYPHTGVGDSYIVAGGNQFGGSIPGGFEGRVWAMDKAVMYAGGALTPITASTGGTEGTPQPLHLHGFSQGSWPAFGSTHYFATDPYDGCTLNIWQWNIPTAPSIISTLNLCTATGVTAGMPVDYPQSGGSPIQANDWRMRGFEYQNGSGWITDSISCNPGSGTVNCARWTEVDLSGTPSIAQAGVYASNGEYRVFPDLAVNQCGDMALGYTKSSTSMFPSIWYTGRESGDPLGTLQAEAQLKAGEIAYLAFDGTPYRWGDYTGMTIDPDGSTFWYLGEYSKITGNPNGRWGTYIGSFSYPACSGSGGSPNIELTKTVGTDPAICAITDAITVTEGTEVTYCYSVENTGDVTFTQHTLTDSELGSLLVDFPYTLAPGASAFITETTTILTTTVNTAIWTAENPSIPASALDSDTATVTVPPPDVVVTPSDLTVTQAVSNVITHTLTIENIGGSTLNWLIEEDPLVLGGNLASPVVLLPSVGSTNSRGGTAGGSPPITYQSPADFSEDFADITVLPGWFMQNNSNPVGTTGWFQGNDAVFPAHAGAPTAYIGANFNNTAGTGTISNWLLTPELNLADGDTFSFWTRTVAGSIYPDRLQVRLSIAGASTNVGSGAEDVGDFTNLLLDINPTLVTGVYPEAWTQFTVTLSGISAGTTGRFAFRYYVTNGGPTGANSNYIGIDTVEYVSNPVPTVCSAPTDIPWVSVNPASGSTPAGGSSDVGVVFDTNGLTIGSLYTGTLCISSNDPDTPLVTVPLSLTVEGASYGVDLSANQSASGDAGTTVVYTLTITNTGNTVDTFDLSASGLWGQIIGGDSITLAGGESATFTVEVTIPSNASDGETEVTTVTATSQNDATATDSTELTTTAIVEGYSIYLPIVFRQP